MRRHPITRLSAISVLALLTVVASIAVSAAAARDTPEVCQRADPGVSCTPGRGRQTPGGGDKVSHEGWPSITGVLMQADNSGRTMAGGELNDELLGGHGNDHAVGGGGADVLWGDRYPTGNTTRQGDILSGGPGNDWIYPSHGTNIIRGGAGDDHVIAYYGHGTIDCGPGRDAAQVRANGAYRLRGCERVTHFCHYGSLPDGTCLSPTGKPVRGRAARRS